MAEPNTSDLKATLIAQNECLSEGKDLMVGAETATLDLNVLFQRVVAYAHSNPESEQLTAIYTAGFVRREDFVGLYMLITANEITSISYEECLLQKTEDRPHSNAGTIAA